VGGILSRSHLQRSLQWDIELTFQYENDEDLENQIYDLAAEMSSEADSRNGVIECHFSEVGFLCPSPRKGSFQTLCRLIGSRFN